MLPWSVVFDISTLQRSKRASSRLSSCKLWWLQIIRGIAMGLALIMYGREEEAETLIEQMSRDQDPILRWVCAVAQQ